jgi:hypothetical protein
MPALINWPLLAEPYNWIIVALMLSIAVFLLHALQDDTTHLAQLSAVV